MLLHGHVLNNFGLGVIVPILKTKTGTRHSLSASLNDRLSAVPLQRLRTKLPICLTFLGSAIAEADEPVYRRVTNGRRLGESTVSGRPRRRTEFLPSTINHSLRRWSLLVGMHQRLLSDEATNLPRLTTSLPTFMHVRPRWIHAHRSPISTVRSVLSIRS